MEEQKYIGYSKTAVVVVHPIEDAEKYAKLVGDINPVHYQDELAAKAYELLTAEIPIKRKGDFLKTRSILAANRANKRIIQGLYSTNVSTIDLLPPELRTNVVGHTCMFVNPWLNSGEGEAISTEISYKETLPARVGDREVPIYAFQVTKTIKEIPEWFMRSALSTLDEESIERIIKDLEDIELLFNGYIFASAEPIDLTNVNTMERPYDRRTRISIDSESLVNRLLTEKEVRRTSYGKTASTQLNERMNPSLVLTDILREVVLDEVMNRESLSIVTKTFNFDPTEFEAYKKVLKLDPNAPLGFDYFESKICGIALELANRKNLFKESFMVYASQNFKANGNLSLNVESIPRDFSIVGISQEPNDKDYTLECAILSGDKLLGIGTTTGVLIGGEKTEEVRSSIAGYFAKLFK